MPRPVLGAALTALLLALASTATAAPSAGPAFRSCGSQAAGRTQCARVVVPVDRNAPDAGEIRLAIRRSQAGRTRVVPRREAVLFLAGGPGEAATPVHGQVLGLLRPLLRTRDLLTVDSRGTGRSSDLIVCPELGQGLRELRDPSSVASCARRLGGAADRYATSDVVADLEAVRAAAGYDRLLLVGVSYGTYAAQRYAAAHPDRVSGLVLDSPVDAAADDPFGLATARAGSRLLAQACASRACAGVTADPRGDLTRLQQRLPIQARVDDGRGRRVATTIGGDVLLQLIGLGDFEPLLRGPLPGAIRRAATGDPAPLVRLAREDGLLDGLDDDTDPSEVTAPAAHLSTGTMIATLCRDAAFPWTTETAPGAARLAAGRAALAATSDADRGGYSPDAVFDAGVAPSCAWWPSAPERPAVGPLPAVPTLILSGREDARTPTETAARIAGRTPGAQLLVVPGAGHSLLAAERRCVQRALARFAAGGGALDSCPSARPPRAARLPPASARELGRTPRARARAVARLTTADAAVAVVRRLILSLDLEDLLSDQPLPSLRVAGLRSGYARMGRDAVLLRRYGYVPGTAVSGDVGDGRTTVVRVRGRGLRAGSYRIPNPLNDPESLLEAMGIDPEAVELLEPSSVRAIERLTGPSRRR